jgi:hypothetical protein
MKQQLPMILLIACVALVTWNIRGCMTKTPPNEKLIRAEEQIKAIEVKRISDSLVSDARLKAKDMEIASIKNADTVFVNKLSSNDKKIKASNDRVNSLTDAELERDFANY